MSTPRKASAGGWETWIQVTVDGKRVRRHIRGRTRQEVSAEAARSRIEIRGGVLPGGGSVTVAAWLDAWTVERQIAGVRPSTLSGYRTDLKHLRAAIGNVVIERLTPERISRLWADLMAAGLSAGSVRHVRRTLSAAMTVAVDRGRLTRNPVRLAAVPADATPDVEPLTVDEARAILEAARHVRNGGRWAVALALGLRQGEALALRWSDLDLDAGTLKIARSMDRKRWLHGCAGGACGRTPGRCPQRVGTGGPAPLKTKGSARSLALPSPLLLDLRLHRIAQHRERLRAGDMWIEQGWMFATEVGTAVHHRADHDAFKRLLAVAQIRPARIHDLRHTAATIQLGAGTDSRVLMSLFGWSSPVLVARYAHVVEDTKRQAAQRMGEVLWEQDAERPDSEAGAR